MPPAMYSLAMGMATLPAAAQSYAQVVTTLIPASELLRGTTAIYLHKQSAPSRTRTDTVRILSPLPLPIGLWGRRRSEPRTSRLHHLHHTHAHRTHRSPDAGAFTAPIP
jgi:hypothetical protein